MVYINKKILDMCEERGWSLYELAEKTGVPYSTLNSSVNRNAPPKIETLERVCETFGISRSQFFMEDEEVEVLSKKEKELIVLFRNLSLERQNALVELIKN